ncbi:unnamed protein product [Malus baccata var. baccata]
MIHRAVLGSLERFFGVVIEHYAGDFPLWLSPVQAHVLPVTDSQLDYCKEVTNKLKANGIRGELCQGEHLPKLFRNSEMQKIPLMAVVGAKEVETGTVTVRSRFGGDLGTMPIDDFKKSDMGSKFVLRATFFLFLVALFIKAKAADIDIKKFGAKADGKTDDSQVQFSSRFDQEYCPNGQCQAKMPSRVKISNVSFKNIRGTSADPVAVKLACSKGIPCQNVEISDINLTCNGKNGTCTSVCSNVNPTVTGKVFYVTSLRYRGNSKGDITQAVANAWRDACASPWPAKVIIPKWEYYLRGANLKGPCKAPIEIQVQGYLRAPQDRSRLIQQGTWVRFQHVNRLMLFGGGTFDGQNNCYQNLMFDFVTNSIIKGITSLDSKYFYINAHECRNVTLQYLTITAPEDSHSTDGIHIGSSFGITINHTTIIGTGDDCVSVIDGRAPQHLDRANLGLTVNKMIHPKSRSAKLASPTSRAHLQPQLQSSFCAAENDRARSGKRGTLTSRCAYVKPSFTHVPDALACANWSYSPTPRTRRNFTNVLTR